MKSYTFAALLTASTWAGCGDDAEARYAGLASITRSDAQASYRLRFRAPPWKEMPTDPLVLGRSTSVSVGGVLHPFSPGTATVLSIGTSTVADVPGENYPKYRLEVALLPCASGERSGASSCAEALYRLDRTARLATSDAGVGDAGQAAADAGSAAEASATDDGTSYYELYARDEENRRNRRVVFYETPDSDTALWLFIEGYPLLDEVETTRMVRAVSIGSPTPTSESP